MNIWPVIKEYIHMTFKWGRYLYSTVYFLYDETLLLKNVNTHNTPEIIILKTTFGLNV
jgi:hypothetical protein